MGQRFSWSRADNQTGCSELKKRNIQRELYRDSHLTCFVRNCGRKCKRGDRCYYPTAHVGPDNKVIAHVDCIDRQVEAKPVGKSLTSQTIRGGSQQESALKQRSPSSSHLADDVTPGAKDTGAELLLEIEKLRMQIWQEGYEAGVAAALAQLAGKNS